MMVVTEACLAVDSVEATEADSAVAEVFHAAETAEVDSPVAETAEGSVAETVEVVAVDVAEHSPVRLSK
jgi:hypothetical protein